MSYKNKCHSKPLEEVNVSLGKTMPNISVDVVRVNNTISKFNLQDELRDNQFILFVFYPANFTFVCPTELISLHNRIGALENRNTKVFAISTDSVHSHIQWKEMPTNKAGIGRVDFDMISDSSHEMSKMFGVFNHTKNVAMRGNFIFDKHAVLRHSSINDFGIGRNFDEVIRLIDAIHHYDENGEVCPAGWNKNDNSVSIKENSQAVGDFLENNSKKL